MEPENENYTSDNNSTVKLKGPKGWAHKLKNGAKNLLKGFINVGKDSKKNIFKAIFIMLMGILKFALPVILALAAVWYVISSDSHVKLVSSVDSYISYSSSLSAEAKEAFEENGSLLYLTNADIKEISNSYLQSLQRSNNSLFEVMSTANKIGSYNISSLSYTNGFEISNAYEYILNSERMNFNRVSWKKYERDTGKIVDLETQTDTNTNLKYPKNDDDTTKDLSYFTNILMPYMQSYVIPSSMLSGIASKGDYEGISNFVYQIIDKGYHNVEVLQYTLQSATREQTNKQYVTENVTLSVYTLTYECLDIDAQGEQYTTTCTDYGYLKAELDAAQATAQANYKTAVSNNTVKTKLYNNSSTKVEKQYVYPVVKAEALKTTMQADYEQIKYNSSDVQNFTNADMSYNTGTEDYSEITGLEEMTAISNSNWTKSDKTVQISIETGQKITTKYIWSDKLEEKSTEERTYNVDDVATFINKIDKVVAVDSDASTVSAKEMFQTSDYNYYKELENDKDITRIDLINAVPSIYNAYLISSDNYSKYVGFSRAYLSMSYSLLNKHLKEISTTSESTNWAGLSIGSISGLDMIWPLDYYGGISSVFGVYRPEIGQFVGHSGIDITPTGHYVYPSKSSYTGSYVYAASSGTVVGIFKETPRDQGNASSKCPDTAQGANYSCGGVSTYGRHIKIKDDNGYTIVYGHLYEIASNIEKGSRIEKGQVLGVMGTTGSSTGVHLHFEVRESPGNYENAVDPLKITSIITARELLK